MVAMDSRKSVKNLGETVHSLLGLKAHLTSNWVRSVCEIVKKVPPEKSVELEQDGSGKAVSDTKIEEDSDSAIVKVKDELAAKTSHVNELNVQRRKVLNEYLDLKGNIRVFCRIRPITLGENFGRLRPVVAVDASNVLLRVAENKSKSYSFDKVFPPGSTQDEVFSEIEPVIKSVLDGYNACIFAYGQTGTGKTFTMEGTPSAQGVVPRTINALFKQAAESNHAFLISFSMLEIYMGNIKDLLVPKPTKPTDLLPPCLTIQADPKGGIEINNLVTIQVNDFHQALRLYKLGCRFRSTASTNANITSSRSHCLIRIAITCYNAPERRRETNKIWLVDLGGSERVLKTKAWGKRLDEGKAINLSLSALGDVINALQRKKGHVPYRNSKLTQVLKDSLGDDSKTLMLVHVSPKEDDLCETICSLNFATRAKSIHLGDEETIEATKLKEAAMADLQQTMKEIENERLHVKTEIDKLKKKLENLTGVNSSPEEQVEACNLFMEETVAKKNNGLAAHATRSLPGFMRPTVCSRRKSGTSYQTLEARSQVRKRRSSSSQRAGSVTFPVQNRSENNSEQSIVSCLVGMETRYGADNVTECSQDTFEIDVTGIGAEEKAPKNLISKKSTNTHSQGRRYRQENKANPTHFSKVDIWLHQQKTEAIVNGHDHGKKRVLGIPLPEKKHKSNELRKGKICDDRASICKFEIEHITDHETDIQVAQETITPESEVGINKPMPTLQDLFNTQSDFIALSETTEEEKRLPTQESIDCLSVEDSEYSASSSLDELYAAFYKYQEHNKEEDESSTPAIEMEIQRLGECSPSNSRDILIISRGVSSVSNSLSELESCDHQLPSISDTEGSRKDPDTFPTYSAKVTKLDPLQLRSKRALFTNNAKEKDPAESCRKADNETETTGTWCLLKQKTEIVYAATLLGLGLSDLGLEHDFFHGLTY